ncbi:class IV adenylate cyclase [Haloferax mediterranei ATCC 33500]|uniref:Adenylate cyclase n=1 Tax=Haloferax mediterranei (strain ATCC 33500 / DSM 1411 / JCM 8866 / NBRC 14739 / NCIMB 2177 / R-4) TaxID=523841 RepID=I3R5D4_HALMT|nr:class IV adenylate cyclase [Haloferax mediterranei]AFK19444.1 adenylate cyclase [Haloferax mediterranei ATCC 33500]AHZ21207.1 adenylate cyclase [Haloferax mediterranei ATCC 33500]EMA04367.1 adenylate cyclase [Haloferax mediterranei ATCC 33500]MDX5989547.1 class IV adenylate cyclase [Haloferax mediterranei ATCC 33500]QCQ75905.1 class IV adenylate cyclase [Haloferax mediterranei ATCC 33500]
MYEVEVKVRADHETIREQLEASDAEQVNRVEQTDIYYNAPHKDFAETDEALRLRRESRYEDDEVVDEVTVITYKGPLVDESSKTRREYETGVDDGETMDAICEAVGFEPTATVEKERERFELDGYTVSLDAVSGLGEFVEVEVEVESGVDAAREGAFDVLRKLDVDPDDQIRTSYLGMLLGAPEE